MSEFTHLRKTLRTHAAKYFLWSIAMVFLLTTMASAQETPPPEEAPAPQETPQTQEVPKEVRQMTPEQIETRIQSMGLTREQAEAQAKARGIDVDAFLRERLVQRPEEAGGEPVQEEPADVIEQTDIEPEEAVDPEEQEALEAEKDLVGDRGLRFFGYRVFRNVPSAFEPQAAGPVDPEYVIGPEDVIRISIWGQVELRNELAVDREGRIFVPTVGPVVVSGMTLEKAFERLKVILSRSYSGLTSDPPTVWMDLTIARLRPKKVFMMGQVRRPGGYTVSSYATVFNSLYSVGGPTIRGSLRDVRVIRNDRIIIRVDLYDYLTGATRTNDIRVQSNDIIFIPLREKTVAIEGEVRIPGIFELKEKEGLADLIRFAGGVRSTAYAGRIQIERILPLESRPDRGPERVFIDIDAEGVLEGRKTFALEDRDIVKIFKITDARLNFVTLEGAVTRPGTYQVERVPTVKDLVLAADSLLPVAYTRRAEVIRTRSDLTKEAIEIDLAKALVDDPRHNIPLQPLDLVHIFSRMEMESRPNIMLRGHVLRPGEYAYADSLRLYDLLFRAGGLQDSLFRVRTFLPRADLIRMTEDGLDKRIIPFNLGKLLADRTGDRFLRPGDEIVVYDKGISRELGGYIDVFGKVEHPGRIEWKTNMTLTDAILSAGGYTEDAFVLQAEIARYQLDQLGRDSLSQILFAELPKLDDPEAQVALTSETQRALEFRLQHRDMILVRMNPDYKDRRSVVLSGEVKYPGRYALATQEERISDVVRRSGGLLPSAYAKGAVLFRNNRRVLTNVREALTNPRNEYDIILHGGDELTIPEKPNAVTITGEVFNPGIIGYVAGDKLWDYVEHAGGVTDSAQYVILEGPNGYMHRYASGGFAAFFEGDPEVEDGSRIIVTKQRPVQPGEDIDWSATLKDTLALVASLLTIVVLSQRLQ